MGKKLAVIFPGVGYTVEKPLLYYSKKILKSRGYDTVDICYTGLENESIFESTDEGLIANGIPTNRVSKEKLLAFVAKAKDLAVNQLDNIKLSEYDNLVFVSKSIGAIVGAICAKQMGVKPYQIMLTPIDYGFQFIDGGSGTVFCGSNDSLVNDNKVKTYCKELGWDFYSFKDCNHSLESGDIDADLDNLKKYVSAVESSLADFDKCIYDFNVLGRKQQLVPMSNYKGKVLLIVNTATGCGFTPQYQALEAMYRKYKDRGLEILDFPCNQFSNQAPGTDDEIYSFCTSRYEITFDQFSKICVNGEDQTDLYKYLKACKGFKGFDMSKQDSVFLVRKLEKLDPNYESSSDIKWNFTKFLVNRNGQVVERFEPTSDMELLDEAIQMLL